MTPSDVKPDLIARLEAATEGSRELDIDIGELQGFIWQDGGWCGADGDFRELPSYTTSLDAAMTLVPEGLEWMVSNRAKRPHTGRAYVHNKALIFAGLGGMTKNPEYRGYEHTASTPALALCVVVLKARTTPPTADG